MFRIKLLNWSVFIILFLILTQLNEQGVRLSDTVAVNFVVQRHLQAQIYDDKVVL